MYVGMLDLCNKQSQIKNPDVLVKSLTFQKLLKYLRRDLVMFRQVFIKTGWHDFNRRSYEVR